MMRFMRRFNRDETGLTLVELIVAMAVSAIIVAAVGGFFAATLRAGKTNSNADSNARQSSNVMSVFTRYVHAASLLPQSGGTYLSAITQADPTALTFYAYVNLSGGTGDQPVKVSFYVDGGVLKEQQWDAVLGQDGFYTFPTLSRTIVLGGPIASPTIDGNPLFSYLNATGGVIANPSGNFGSIRAVQVNLELGSTTKGAAGNTNIQNTLYLFNVGYSTSTTAPTP